MKKMPRWMKSAIEASKKDVPALPKGLGQTLTAAVPAAATGTR